MVNKNRIKDEFCRLVAFDSISFQERIIADELIKSLNELGFQVMEDKAGDCYSGNCGNIYGYLPGELEGEPLLFSAHMDTVEPGINKKAVVHKDGRITSDGDTVLGADDISGVVSILEAVRVLKERSIPHRSIEVLFTIAEEVYLKGSNVFDFQNIRAKEAYVLDLDGPVGLAAIKAPTLVSFTVKMIGKASHAGFAPEAGINAIAAAAEAITLMKQGRIDEDTTVNIGMIKGGKARNIISDEVVFMGEARSLVHEKALDEIKKLEAVLQTISEKYQTSYELETSFGSLAYEIEKDHMVVKRFESVCKELGYESKLISTFGGSDNNNFVREGIKGIVIACGMNAVHSCAEYTHIEELVKCANIVLKLMTSEVIT